MECENQNRTNTVYFKLHDLRHLNPKTNYLRSMADVLIIMGSDSDLPVMAETAKVLEELEVSFDLTVVSAHRTADRMYTYAKEAHTQGYKCIVAGAGGAAHLPGMVASMTHLPVLGVPIESKALSGMDSLLSIAQMPGGIPVGTLAIGKAGALAQVPEVVTPCPFKALVVELYQISPTIGLLGSEALIGILFPFIFI